MIYEKHIQSNSALRRELVRLDGDAGVRVVGKFRGKNCYAFVTRFGTVYTVLVYSVQGQKRAPGRRLLSKEFSGAEEALSFLSRVSGPKVDAYAY